LKEVRFGLAINEAEGLQGQKKLLSLWVDVLRRFDRFAWSVLLLLYTYSSEEAKFELGCMSSMPNVLPAIDADVGSSPSRVDFESRKGTNLEPNGKRNR
jgi:hypothetical protein